MSAPKRKREVQLNFRVSPEELALIEQKMAQLGTTNREAYLRKMALDGYVSSFIFGLASTVVALLGVAVLVTYSPQNGVILLVIAFLVSPLGLPMAAAWLVGKVQDLRYAIQDAVYG